MPSIATAPRKKAIVFTTTPSESMLFITQTLQARGHEISAIVTAPGPNALLTETHYQQLGARISSYTATLAEHNAGAQSIPPILVVYKASQVEATFIAQDPDLAVCFGFPYRLTSRLLRHRAPVINLHSAPLPQLRGPNPHVWPILRPDKYGVEDFAVTWHYMVPGVDQGPIIKSERLQFRSRPLETLTSAMLEREAAAAMLGALDEVVALVEEGYPGTPQPCRAQSDKMDARTLTDEERTITEDMAVEEVLRLFRAIGDSEYPPLIRFQDGLYAVKGATRNDADDGVQEEPGTAKRCGLSLRFSCIGGSLMFSLRKL